MEIIQVDDNLEVGSKTLLETEDHEPKAFLSKLWQPLQPNVICFKEMMLLVRLIEVNSMTQK